MLRLLTVYKRPLSASPKSQSISTSRLFTVLAFESSADDTCVAIVNSEREILSNVVIKQHDEHERFGGIQPYVALQKHQRNMPIAVKRAFTEANMTVNDIDGIAFTRGPGMHGCLAVGANAAKSLAAALNKPLIGVHHMQAHALTPLLTQPTSEIPQFPFLTLLVSGGHTLLLLANKIDQYEILATTKDESIGRAFDQVSALLEIPWNKDFGPGAALEQLCAKGPPIALVSETGSSSKSIERTVGEFPRPLKGKLEFSFAGLHSHIDRLVKNKETWKDFNPEQVKYILANGFQQAAVGQLEEKLALGMKECRRRGLEINHVVVSGGVASNTFLRKRLRACLGELSPTNPIHLVFPPPALCTDNAVMIAWASMHRFLAEDFDDLTIDLRPKWSIHDLRMD
ncbi:tRNA N6-adenosine threonylcarbamoyltransferase, mitochondrial [Abortiporus biennis]